jgi:hypothetical protein
MKFYVNEGTAGTATNSMHYFFFREKTYGLWPVVFFFIPVDLLCRGMTFWKEQQEYILDVFMLFFVVRFSFQRHRSDG